MKTEYRVTGSLYGDLINYLHYQFPPTVGHLKLQEMVDALELDCAKRVSDARTELQRENAELHKAVEEVIELMEHALHMPPALGDLERTIARLKSLRNEHTS